MQRNINSSNFNNTPSNIVVNKRQKSFGKPLTIITIIILILIIIFLLLRKPQGTNYSTPNRQNLTLKQLNNEIKYLTYNNKSKVITFPSQKVKSIYIEQPIYVNKIYNSNNQPFFNGLGDQASTLIKIDESGNLIFQPIQIDKSQVNNIITNIVATNGLTGGGDSGQVTIQHANTSNQPSVFYTNKYISGIGLDQFGHVTKITASPLPQIPQITYYWQQVQGLNNTIMPTNNYNNVYIPQKLDINFNDVNSFINSNTSLAVNGNVGIGTDNADLKLTLDNDGGIVAKGTFGSGKTLETQGTGTRFIWYPKKGAIRAGVIDTYYGNNIVTESWDDANIGLYSVAFGRDVIAKGISSIAIGEFVAGMEERSIGIGYISGSLIPYSGGIGWIAVVEGDPTQNESDLAIGHSVRIRNSTFATGVGHALTIKNSKYSHLFGWWSVITNSYDSLAVGHRVDMENSRYAYIIGERNTINNSNRVLIAGLTSSITNSEESFVVGYRTAIKNSQYSLALGSLSLIEASKNSFAVNGTITDGERSIAINSKIKGHNNINLNGEDITDSTIENSLVLGNKASVASSNSIALGYTAVSKGVNSIAIGASSALAPNSIALGGPSLWSSNQYTITIGHEIKNEGDYNILVGSQISLPTGINSPNSIGIGRNIHMNTNNIVIGFSSTAKPDSIVLGYSSQSLASKNIILGFNTTATHDDNIALGDSVTVSASRSVGIGVNSTSEDSNSIIIGNHNHTQASNSVALGNNISTSGTNSLAIGNNIFTLATNNLAIGNNNIARKENNTTIGFSNYVNAERAIVIGINSNALGLSSTSIGDNTQAQGQNSTAIGYHASSIGNNSLALGYSTAINENSIAIGNTSATNKFSISLGTNNDNQGDYAIAIGTNVKTQDPDDSNAENAIAIGRNTTAQDDSIAIGYNASAKKYSSIAIGTYSQAEDEAIALDGRAMAQQSIAISGDAYNPRSLAILGETQADDSIALGLGGATFGQYSIAIGEDSNADNIASIAIGYNSNANDLNTIAIGREADASGEDSVAYGYGAATEGENATSIGSYSYAEGDYSIALGNAGSSGEGAIAIGSDADSEGDNSIALGTEATTIGENTIAIGKETYIEADNAMALGLGIRNTVYQSIVLGSYNEDIGGDQFDWTDTDPLLIIGNGQDDTNRSNAMVILKNGNTGILTNSPTHALQVGEAGDGTDAIANAWNTFSDIRFKKDIKPINNALDIVNQLNGVYYTWKKSNKESIGFIAQEVKPILPYVVTQDRRGYLGIDYSKFTPLLTNAIKELNTKVGENTHGLQNINVLLTGQQDNLDDQLVQNMNNLASFFTWTNKYITLTKKLVVKAKVIFNKIVRFTNKVIFTGKVIFRKIVTFKGDSYFYKAPTFMDADMAGRVIINKNHAQITVQFFRPYKQAPIINVTHVGSQPVAFTVTNITKTGFTIKLSQPAIQDEQFNWIAIYAPNAQTTQNITSTPSPTPSTTPTGTPTPTNTPTPTSMPTPTATPTPSNTPTPTGTPTPTPTRTPTPTNTPTPSPTPTTNP